jgi:hypothetical protein
LIFARLAFSNLKLVLDVAPPLVVQRDRRSLRVEERLEREPERERKLN